MLINRRSSEIPWRKKKNKTSAVKYNSALKVIVFGRTNNGFIKEAYTVIKVLHQGKG